MLFLLSCRFQWVAEFCSIKSFTIVCEIEFPLLSPETNYACYLVYKVPKKHSMVDGLLLIGDETQVDDKYDFWRQKWRFEKKQLVDLLTPTHIPFIRSKEDESHDIPPITCNIKGHPKLRKDGWLEIQVWDFNTGATRKPISMHCNMMSYHKYNFTGLLVQGIEFRPAKVSFPLQ